MDDDARSHRSHIVEEFHEGVDIRRIDWSAGLNSVEHVWDGIGKANSVSQSLLKLKAPLLEKWTLLPQLYLLTPL
ncbi:hypothetical protein TNCV_3847711 [Trichonephila clavipes]|nr:hypothetical protein TNCV_3847711 [Trichonephila clavipes]